MLSMEEDAPPAKRYVCSIKNYIFQIIYFLFFRPLLSPSKVLLQEIIMKRKRGT